MFSSVLPERSTENRRYCHFLFPFAKFDLFIEFSCAKSPAANIGTVAFAANCNLLS